MKLKMTIRELRAAQAAAIKQAFPVTIRQAIEAWGDPAVNNAAQTAAIICILKGMVALELEDYNLELSKLRIAMLKAGVSITALLDPALTA